ncbi:hypothetical protein JXA85_06905 [Candidatus Woesearchaeota archaeon]|nr:hypothetical protein [Candidatus Woesearchaeota archaeon]
MICMLKKKSNDESIQYLQDVPAENVFWVQDGRVLKNLEELHMALSEMSDETFQHHVNEEKNDFHNWVRDVINDRMLAKELAKAKDKNAAHKKVKSRVQKLHKSRSKKK